MSMQYTAILRLENHDFYMKKIGISLCMLKTLIVFMLMVYHILRGYRIYHYFFHFVLCLFNVPVNNFTVMSGRSNRFLGIISTFWEVNVSCSRTQHGDPSEDQTPTSHSGYRRSSTRPPHISLALLPILHTVLR